MRARIAILASILGLCGGLAPAQSPPRNLDGSPRPVEKPLDIGRITTSLTNSVLPAVDLSLPDTALYSQQEIETRLLKTQAMALIKEKDYARAITLFKRVIALVPNDKSARFGLGTALIQAGQYLEAIELFKQMIAESPDDYFVKNNLAWLYATARDIRYRDGRKAAQLALDALLLQPDDYHVWSTLAEAYYVSGEYEKGMRAAGQALYLSRKKDAAAHLLLEYDEQYKKCRRAALTLSILE